MYTCINIFKLKVYEFYVENIIKMIFDYRKVWIGSSEKEPTYHINE